MIYIDRYLHTSDTTSPTLYHNMLWGRDISDCRGCRRSHGIRGVPSRLRGRTYPITVPLWVGIERWGPVWVARWIGYLSVCTLEDMRDSWSWFHIVTTHIGRDLTSCIFEKSAPPTPTITIYRQRECRGFYNQIETNCYIINNSVCDDEQNSIAILLNLVLGRFLRVSQDTPELSGAWQPTVS